ncbi:MAG: hypothetical protein A2W74_05440 [Planctomycetes bacterium RIFCSPLOWO2_12_38_17]|nr:MAG: hypothetical protein A2W74_05440 [Planctomycetes bacterium RIFCSPLOWO2_12_38_17]
MDINVTPRFTKSYQKLPKDIQGKAKAKESIFRKNPFDKQLRTHKLLGKEKEAWSFWVDYSYRIKFIFLKKDQVLFLDVGKHDFYK